MVEIILLAMVALFVGLRLYAVLGRRTGHEQPVAKPVEAAAAPARPRAVERAAEQPAAGGDSIVEPRAMDGIRAIAAADPQFEAQRFLEGAKAAYGMVLQAYWAGDEDALRRLADESVVEAFAEAIAARREAGEVLDNRLIAIERAVIEKARLEGQMAIVTVRFDADIAAVTRNAQGEVVAGSTTDAIQTHDVWVFSRHVRADDPNWVLVETDEA